MIYQALMFISLVRRKKKWNRERRKKPIDRWGSLVVAIVNDGGFLFVKWQPSLFIRFVSFVSWTRSNECFKVSLEKTLPNEIQLNRDDDTQLHSSCGLYICIYIYTHIYVSMHTLHYNNWIEFIEHSKKKKMMHSETNKRSFYILL